MGKQTEQEMPTVAYAIVSSKEEDAAGTLIGGAPMANATAVELNEPNVVTGAVPVAYHNIAPDTKDLTWRDDFFEDYQLDNKSNEIVAVFDFDYGSMEAKSKCLTWTCLGAWSVACPSIIPWFLIGLVPCHVNQNVRWNVRSRHVALTTHGILWVQDARPACWGEGCWRVPRRSKFIPYESISQCTVTEAGEPGTCGPPQLSKVMIDTSSWTGTVERRHGNSCHHDLEITGLENPQAFQRLVMAMKGQASALSTTSMTMNDRLDAAVVASTATTNEQQQEVVAVLLREIRDELRQVNASRQPQESPVMATALVQPSAPSMQED
eukprot:CAMPEP_0172476672 /NCGR_PEP_ID=MMETSP1065-20121228/70500_1 /TAXON_ID=265537 /ORGANISM="Amphiprora paludosa, Strain CCMP125" /LENGTH=322 /DNA_ID=CAMNT_0013234901 /DNA_START=32 /DNA_END=1003 /DNA_ORIENTATION=+